MKTNLVRNLAALATFVAASLFLSACNGATTPDAAAIATSAVQTVEARYTQQAPQTTPTEAPTPTTANTSTPKAMPTSTPQPVDTNGKLCYKAIFLEDVTVPDGMIVAPGSIFTKKWKVLNDGNCTWDRTYSLILASGDAMGTVVSVPLSTAVGPGDSIVLAVDLTASTTNGEYTGYWRIATPFGGTFGVGVQDQSLIVKINVTDKPKRDEGIAGIDIGLYQRFPAKGCNTQGAAFTFNATITANSALENVTYHWNRYPYDGSKPEGGKLNFPAAGSKTVTFTWTFQKEAIQDIDRSVEIVIDNPTLLTSKKIHFTFTCQQ